MNFSKNSKKIQNFISCVFLYLLKGHIKKFSALKLKRCDLSFFLKPKMSKFDLFLDPWPLTFWPMTLTFCMWQDITKTHILCKFHKDPPMGTWWKVGDYLTDWLTHWLTKPLLRGERCHPKSVYISSKAYKTVNCTFILRSGSSQRQKRPKYRNKSTFQPRNKTFLWW